MTERADVVVVGAGHNGLACAAALARAGRKVLVLEAAGQVGGGAVTREFAPGFRVSAVAHLLYALDPELGLARHGLEIARSRLRTVALSPSGAALVIDDAGYVSGDLAADDRAALAEHLAQMRRFAAVLGRQHGRLPPRLSWDGWREAMPAAQLALDIRRLGRDDMREFLRIAAINIFDVLDETFDSPLLKGALALDAVLGTHAGPRSGNTVLSALHRVSVAIDGRQGTIALPKGGMGAVSDALAAAARAAGVEIRTSSPVASITVGGGRIAGVRLAGGAEISAPVVVSNADPRTTLLGLVGARHLEAGFAKKVANVRAKGTAAKLHLALSGAPAFTGVAAADLGERLVIAPDPDYVERAFNPVKYGGFSPEPVLEISVPSVHDPSLAPAGRHVLSAIVQYAPHDRWDAPRRASFEDVVLGILERHAPGIRRLVTASELLTPAEVGHWHHAELALDQLLMLRPVPGASRYAMPVDGLYLCGAGCHPGGGVMGTAGRNAARAVLDGEQAG